MRQETSKMKQEVIQQGNAEQQDTGGTREAKLINTKA